MSDFHPSFSFTGPSLAHTGITCLPDLPFPGGGDVFSLFTARCPVLALCATSTGGSTFDSTEGTGPIRLSIRSSRRGEVSTSDDESEMERWDSSVFDTLARLSVTSSDLDLF